MEAIIRRILEAARAECGGQPEAAFVQASKVLRRALEAADDLSPASRRALADEVNEVTPAVERYYDVLVRLVHGCGWEPLLEGQGNFGAVCYGFPGDPPTHARYTEVRITRRGLDYLRDTAEPSAAADRGGMSAFHDHSFPSSAAAEPGRLAPKAHRMGVAEDIIAARIDGAVRCGLSSLRSPTVPELAREFGLRDEAECYKEIDEPAAPGWSGWCCTGTWHTTPRSCPRPAPRNWPTHSWRSSGRALGTSPTALGTCRRSSGQTGSCAGRVGAR